MNTQFFTNRAGNRDPKTRLAWCLSLAGVMVMLCVVAGLLLRPSESETRTAARLPAGQYAADTRTLIAALRYLLETGSDDDWRLVATIGNPRTFAVQATSQQFTPFGNSSNQMQTSEPFTNRPVRS